MIRVSRSIRLIALFLAALTVSFGLGALFPSLREAIAHAAGVSDSGSKIATATNMCTPESGDSDDIYFLSCGGIY
jgi:hypothetical protein